MNLKLQRDIGYGLMCFGCTLLTGFVSTSYEKKLFGFYVYILVTILLLFLAIKDAVNLKAKNSEISYKECLKLTGSLYLQILLAFYITLLVGGLRG